MDIQDLITRFSDGRERQGKAIFSSLFILGNRLQTLFDQRIPELSLKQFMLLSVVRQSPKPMPLTHLGELLGCSRQNVKKLGAVLERKGFVSFRSDPKDERILCIYPTQKAEDFFSGEFAPYQQELACLFEGYSDEEVALLFTLLSRLYQGVDNLERREKL